jgi:hypothetical protein
LQRDFGVDTDPEEIGRAGVMELLLQSYDKEGLKASRPARQVRYDGAADADVAFKQ